MINPYIICNIIISIVFLILLIFNYTFENKIIKTIFTIYSTIFLILILFFDNEFIYQFLKSIITYIWYPNYLIFVVTVIITLIIFIYTINKKYMKKSNTIINYILAIITFICYNMFNTLGINTSLYSELYKTVPLTIMRVTTISFIIWLIVTFVLKIRRSHEG